MASRCRRRILQRLSGMDGDEMLTTLVPGLDAPARKKILTGAGRALSRDLSAAGAGVSRRARGFRRHQVERRTHRAGHRLSKRRIENVIASLMNVDDLMTPSACGDEVSRGKPDPGLVELALDHLGGTPAVFATMDRGDTPFDAPGAPNRRRKRLGTLSGGHPRSSLIDAGCSAVVQSVADIGRYFAPEKPPVSTDAGAINKTAIAASLRSCGGEVSIRPLTLPPHPFRQKWQPLPAAIGRGPGGGCGEIAGLIECGVMRNLMIFAAVMVVLGTSMAQMADRIDGGEPRRSRTRRLQKPPPPRTVGQAGVSPASASPATPAAIS